MPRCASATHHLTHNRARSVFCLSFTCFYCSIVYMSIEDQPKDEDWPLETGVEEAVDPTPEQIAEFAKFLSPSLPEASGEVTKLRTDIPPGIREKVIGQEKSTQ